MTNPRYGAGDDGPGVESPGPSSFPLTLPPDEIAVAAAQVFKERLSLAGRYAEMLGTEGVVRGLIGPRETPRLWERHLVNCGVMSEIIPFGASVVDVGSGAGLPGIVLAVARPDLAITLVEPLARRTVFLEEAVETLGLEHVTVVRGRAEEVVSTLPGADVVTARAVAALDKLAGWCLPLVRTGGRLLALKGASAAEEIAAHGRAVAELGGGEPVVRLCGVGLIEPPATVVEVVKERHVVPGRGRSAGGSKSGRAGSEGRAGAAGGAGAGRSGSAGRSSSGGRPGSVGRSGSGAGVAGGSGSKSGSGGGAGLGAAEGSGSRSGSGSGSAGQAGSGRRSGEDRRADGRRGSRRG